VRFLIHTSSLGLFLRARTVALPDESSA